MIGTPHGPLTGNRLPSRLDRKDRGENYANLRDGQLMEDNPAKDSLNNPNGDMGLPHGHPTVNTLSSRLRGMGLGKST